MNTKRLGTRYQTLTVLKCTCYDGRWYIITIMVDYIETRNMQYLNKFEGVSGKGG